MLSIIVVVPLLLSLLVACDGTPTPSGTEASSNTQPQGSDTVTVWHMNAENFAKPYEELWAQFENENLDIKLDTIPLGWDDFAPKIAAAFVSGNEPDVLEVPPDFVQDQIWSGKIAEIPQYVFTTEYLQETFYPEKLKEWQKEGKQLGLPSVNFAPGAIIIYNKQVFDEAGIVPDENQTWEEFMLCMQDLVVKDGDRITRGAFSVKVERLDAVIFSWIMQEGGALLNEDETKFMFTSTASKQAFQKVIDIYTKYGLDDYSYNRTLKDVVDGTLAACFGAPYQEGIRRSSYPDSKEFGWLIPPSVKPGADPYWPIFDAFGRCVTKKGDKEASWKYLQHMFKPDSVLTFCLGAGQAFVMPELFEHPKAIEEMHEGVRTVQPIIQYGRHCGQVWNASKVTQIIGEVLDSVIYDGKDLDLALEEAENEGNAILSEYRSKFGLKLGE